MERPDGIVDFTPDPKLFPFESRWFDSSVGPVHYLDEGDGPVVLLLHGNPDWSFLYRDIIDALGPDVRCIAPEKDVDGLHPANVGDLARGTPRFAPCTPAGVIEMLERIREGAA